MITSDNCAQANLLKTLLAEKIAEACEANDPEWGTGSYTEAERSSKVRTHEGDCWGHLRNTWFLGAAKAITKEVKMGPADDLENFILEIANVGAARMLSTLQSSNLSPVRVQLCSLAVAVWCIHTRAPDDDAKSDDDDVADVIFTASEPDSRRACPQCDRARMKSYDRK